MNGLLVASVVGGGAAGLGVWLLLVVLMPERPDLVAALAHSHAPAAPLVLPDTEDGRGRRLGAVRARLEARLSTVQGLRAPDADLAVIEMSRGAFLLTRAAAVCGALLIIPVYTVLFALVGLGIPPAVPAVFGLALAGIGWWAVGVWVHTRAEDRRREMRYALRWYLMTVALQGASGQAMGPALEKAAAVSAAWPFRRIAARMSSAVRSGRSEWAGLAALAEEMDMDELSDLAAIADLGADGAGVYATLLARSTALGRQLQSGEQAAAAAASTKLAFPRVLLTLVTFAFLLFPGMVALAATT